MKRVADWWFAPAPGERLAALRIAIGTYALVYVIARFVELQAIARLPPQQFRPIGVTRILEAPLVAGTATAIIAATIVLLALLVAGVRYRVVAPLAAVALLWTTTYRNSWGMVFHTENLMVLHVIALAAMPAADRWSVDARRTQHDAPAGYGWGIKLLLAITVATYVLAAVAKLRIAELDWIDGEVLRNHIALDNLRKAVLGDMLAPLATPFLGYASAFTVFCVLTIAIELGAPVALAGGRIARAWVLAAWSFHAGVVLLMNIWFPYPLLGIAFLPVFQAEQPVQRVLAWWRARG